MAGYVSAEGWKALLSSTCQPSASRRLLGAKIWIENRVNFADPVNLVPLAAGITAGIGNLTIKVTSTFSIAGIATGTLMVIIGYHAVRPFARRPPDEPQPAAP